jgi:hypothetical protein
MNNCHHSRHCRNLFSTFSTVRRSHHWRAPEISTIYGRFHGLTALARAVLLFYSGNNMFRISNIDTDSERRLIVEGTLVHPWVDELRRTWSTAGYSLEGRKLVIDLTNVIVISREGENAIFELMKEGAKFSCGGVLTRHLLKELAHRCHTKLDNVLNRRRSKQ